ncbi:MAG: hypothetical protein ABSD20_10800, partial [Terriglobales bacterium]
ETVAGVAANIVEVEGTAPGLGKVRIWVAQKGNFPLKWVNVSADGQEQTLLEVKQLSFAKPPAADLAPPSGCGAIQGESNATGGHAEVSVGKSNAEDQSLAAAVGGHSRDYVDATHPPEETLTAGCQVSFKIVHAGTLAPITSGFRVKLDSTSSNYNEANQHDVTAQLQGGVLRIDRAPQHFYLDVEFANSGASALIYTRCPKSPMDLLLVWKPGDAKANQPPDGHWLWVNPAKQ